MLLHAQGNGALPMEEDAGRAKAAGNTLTLQTWHCCHLRSMH